MSAFSKVPWCEKGARMKWMQQIELILMKLQRSDIMVDQNIMLMDRVPAARHSLYLVYVTRKDSCDSGVTF
ncbi:hypothetical protein [Owenweeksia hongkongensis]|uniref:hypothetical protein n=1 Tax=Owenweeksia hongkongensis TaxID=253245 RepID=UPI003A8CF580